MDIHAQIKQLADRLKLNANEDYWEAISKSREVWKRQMKSRVGYTDDDFTGQTPAQMEAKARALGEVPSLRRMVYGAIIELYNFHRLMDDLPF